MSYKLPYIPDGNLYSAVMEACSWIKSDDYFSKTVNYYANKYNVDPNDVAKYVHMAQSDGQKKTKSRKHMRKYHWFAVEYSMGNAKDGCNYFEGSRAQYAIVKGLRVETVECRLSKYDDDFSESEPCHWFGRCEPFDTKEEAEECIEKWETERNKKY